MGVHDHRAAAPQRPLEAWVVSISSTRSESDDASGDLAQKLLLDAGHHVIDRAVVPDDVDAIRTLIRGLAGDGTTEVVVCTGGTGLSARDVTPEALAPLISAPIPGFGELFRMLSYQEIGPAAMLSRASAGMVGPVLVFMLPGSPEAVRLGLEKLILPELWHIHHQLRKDAPIEVPSASPGIGSAPPPSARPAARPAPKPPARPAEETEAAEVVAPKLPDPTGKLGKLGGKNSFLVDAAERQRDPNAADEVAAVADKLPKGWQRAVYEIRGEVTRGTGLEIPEELEKISPVVDLLHKSGERGILKLPSGRTYSLFAYPNLEAGSKVIAISSGTPVAEVLALHRWPVMTGTVIDESFGQIPVRNKPAGEVAEAVTGRAPKDGSGQIFAVQADSVWIQRGSKAFRWDGNKERDDGTIKQVLATLMLDWSGR